MIIKDNVYGNVEIDNDAIKDIVKSKVFRRIRGILNSGIPKEFLNNSKYEYSRFEHCIGTMLLLNKLGASNEEQIAGLLHDVSHTAFSHVADYVLKKDGSKEDLQDLSHHKFFEKGTELYEILKRYNLDPKRISNLLNYSLLEREQPEICADRFDYTVRFWARDENKEHVNFVVNSIKNIGGTMIFDSRKAAAEFADMHLTAFSEDNIWSKQFDRSVRWQIFVKALKIALNHRIITKEDFWTDDKTVMNKIYSSKDAEIGKMFDFLRKPIEFKIGGKHPDFIIHNKFRYTNPKFIENGKIYKLMDVDYAYKERVEKDMKLFKDGIKVSLLNKTF